MNGRAISSVIRRVSLTSCILGAAMLPRVAHADVRHEGSWDDDPEVSLNLERTPRAEAVKKLAEAAGWSVVLDNVPIGDPVDMHIRDQPAGKVIDLLLTDAHYVAKRDHTLIVIRRADSVEVAPPAAKPSPSDTLSPPPPPNVPMPPAAPMPPHRAIIVEHVEIDEEKLGHARDREVFGANLRIERGEIVADVSVVGGNVDVYGTVTGDLMVTGGNARIHPGARVMGTVTTMGGSVNVEDRARIDGDVDTIGGSFKRSEAAEIHGDVKIDQRHDDHDGDADHSGSTFGGLVRSAGNAVTRTALLFVFGAVLLSLATDRMERLKTQIAAKPMRSFATGIVAALGFVALLVALCVTIVGIPFALIGVLGGFVAIAAGLCSTLETVGGALLAHRTKNPYVHLAFGCALFLLAGAIPFVGGLVKAAVIFVGIGSVAATRGAGFFPSKNRSNGGPYREMQAD